MQTFLDSEQDSIELTRTHLWASLKEPSYLIVLLWVVYGYMSVSTFNSGEFGIFPRQLWGARGIFTAPLVHGSFSHLVSNTFPLFFLGVMINFFYRKVAWRAFWMIYLLTGISVWLLARPVWHIGASGVVYGMVAFVFWNGIFRRSMKSIILAVIVVLLYSGMFLGILPDQEHVSWESHLLGSLAGIFASFWFKGELEEDEALLSETGGFGLKLSPDAPETYFLERDIFEKTKAQRAAEEAERMRLEAERLRQEEYMRGNFFPPFWNQNSTY